MIRTRQFGIRLAGALLLMLVGRMPVQRLANATALHPHLEESEPEDGETVSGSPERVWLLFSEKVNAGTSRIRLEASDHEAIELRVEPDGENEKAIFGKVSKLEVGKYKVAWFVVGADGHPTSGDFEFRVGDPETDTEP
jgi:methionine-rich copper-binding protein CopC